MVEGRISTLDIANRTATIVDESGTELSVKFPVRVNIEVVEHETVGLVGGDLEDLDIGYHVEMDSLSKNEDGTYICDSLICIS